MSQNLVTIDIFSDFEDIQKQSRVPDEVFKKGIQFALLISEGKNREIAYRDVYDDTDRPRYKATMLMRKKWVSQVIERMIAGNHILFSEEHHTALRELFDIGMNGMSEKNRVDALKAFVENTKMPVKEEVDYKDLSGGLEMLGKMKRMLDDLAGSGVVAKGDSLIDVTVLEA